MLFYGNKIINMETVTAALISNEKRKMAHEFGMQSHDIALMVKAKKEAKILTAGSRQKKPLFEVEYYCR